MCDNIFDLSQAIILTAMASKGDKIDVKIDTIGSNTLSGSQQVSFFRQNYCIYLTKTMFEYLSTVSISLVE